MTNIDSLTNDEILRLRAFQRQFDRICKSSIAAPIRLESSIRFGMESKQVSYDFEGYPHEAFQSQLPIFRQFVLNSEPIYFYSICNLIRMRCTRKELTDWVDFARADWRAVLSRLPGMMEQHLFGMATSVEESLQKLFYGYGGLFHVDINTQDEESVVQKIEQALIQRNFRKLCRNINTIYWVIRLWLDDTNEPVPPLPGPT